MEEKAVQILLVEDNPGDARLLGEVLAEAGTVHFELSHVERLNEACQRFRREVLSGVAVQV